MSAQNRNDARIVELDLDPILCRLINHLSDCNVTRISQALEEELLVRGGG